VAFIDRWTEVVAQRTENGGGVEGRAPEGHEVGNNSAMVRSLCELEWGKGERTGWGSLGKEACERHTSEKRNEGGSGTGTRVKIESRQVCWGKRGV
jgi:hypothetical protein